MRFSLSVRSWFKSFGLALPLVSFMTCPTKKPMSFSFAAPVFRHLFRKTGDDALDRRIEGIRVVICTSPFSRMKLFGEAPL